MHISVTRTGTCFALVLHWQWQSNKCPFRHPYVAICIALLPSAERQMMEDIVVLDLTGDGPVTQDVFSQHAEVYKAATWAIHFVSLKPHL